MSRQTKHGLLLWLSSGKDRFMPVNSTSSFQPAEAGRRLLLSSESGPDVRLKYHGIDDDVARDVASHFVKSFPACAHALSVTDLCCGLGKLTYHLMPHCAKAVKFNFMDNATSLVDRVSRSFEQDGPYHATAHPLATSLTPGQVTIAPEQSDVILLNPHWSKKPEDLELCLELVSLSTVLLKATGHGLIIIPERWENTVIKHLRQLLGNNVSMSVCKKLLQTGRGPPTPKPPVVKISAVCFANKQTSYGQRY